MKRRSSLIVLLFTTLLTLFAQPKFQIDGEMVCSGGDVVFHKIDKHTSVGYR